MTGKKLAFNFVVTLFRFKPEYGKYGEHGSDRNQELGRARLEQGANGGHHGPAAWARQQSSPIGHSCTGNFDYNVDYDVDNNDDD